MMFSKSLTEIFSAWIMHLRKTMWYKPRMKSEKEIIENAQYILGRTTWDRAHSYAINPTAKYYPCSRILRTPFYEEKWSLEKTERHSIYVGNGYSALKGVHFVVMALPYLIKEYPDVKVYVAGYKPYTENDKRSFLKKGYASYLKKLIYDLGVQDHVEFTGPLKAHQVAEKLSKVNAYVLCSTIENSPNTLGEAMMVGTPCVAAYVGGVSDMAEDGKEALFYRNDDPKLLAWNLKRIFDNDELALSLSEAGKKKALITHDAERNAQMLIDAYTDILKEGK
jgi:glycosyltransferase involved in cell wall biosynthesis